MYGYRKVKPVPINSLCTWAFMIYASLKHMLNTDVTAVKKKETPGTYKKKLHD